MENFDVVKAKKDEKFKDYSDYKLILLCQKEMDEHRKECKWECLSCGMSFYYSNSLFIECSEYVHEMNCPNVLCNDSGHWKMCNEKMGLVHKSGNDFQSEYFNELFARYQNRLVVESRNASNVESPDEIYSILLETFMKTIYDFARESKLDEKSKRWFSSFFWVSVRNRIYDISKKYSSVKRSPNIECRICGKGFGRITIKHLLTHKVIEDTIYSMIGSYNTEKFTTNDKMISLGKSKFELLSKEDQKDALDGLTMKAYFYLFPDAQIANNMISINQKTNEGQESEILDVNTRNVFGERQNVVEKIEFNNRVDSLIEIIISEDFLKKHSKLFKRGTSEERKVEILKELFINKSMFLHDKNKEIDKSVENAKDGLTDALLKYIRESRKCKKVLKNILRKELVEGEKNDK